MTPFKSFIFAAAAVAAATLSTTSYANTSFDGRWSVSVATDQACEAGYAVSLRINNGQISYGGLFGASASGRVSEGGALSIRVSSVTNVVKATGALAGKRGAGRWQSPTCAGTWTAQKV